jgi:medium-chain acyl-[acyl-carrier-protein] hydrolase
MTVEPATSPLLCYRPRPDAQLRLFCFHHAGGSAAVFRQWAAGLPAHVELWAAQLSGRSERAFEPPLKRLEPIIADMAGALAPHLDKPFALFGHSMGALVAFELTRLLRRRYDAQPVHLFVSGCQAPQSLYFALPTYNLPESDFVAKLRSLNGTPQALFENPRMLGVVLPYMRADIEVLQTYEYLPDAPLTCPITILGGAHDQVVNEAGLQGWHSQTTSRTVMHILPGDHFFLNSLQPTLLQILADDLSHFAPEQS